MSVENSHIEVECPECDRVILSGNETDLLKIEWELNQTFRGATTKELKEEFQESDRDIETDGFDVTPSLNNLRRYDIDSNKRISEPVDIRLTTECSCGVESTIMMVPDYTGEITLNFEVSPTDNSATSDTAVKEETSETE